MRTTLDIADDILQAAKELAKRQKKTAGQVISELARAAMTNAARSKDEEDPILGFRPFSARGEVVTNEIVDRLREDGPY